MIMNNKSNGKGGNGNTSSNSKALTVIMPNNSSNPKPIAPKVPGGGGSNGHKTNKNSAVPARFVWCERKNGKSEKCGWALTLQTVQMLQVEIVAWFFSRFLY